MWFNRLTYPPNPVLLHPTFPPGISVSALQALMARLAGLNSSTRAKSWWHKPAWRSRQVMGWKRTGDSQSQRICPTTLFFARASQRICPTTLFFARASQRICPTTLPNQPLEGHNMLQLCPLVKSGGLSSTNGQGLNGRLITKAHLEIIVRCSGRWLLEVLISEGLVGVGGGLSLLVDHDVHRCR